MAPPCEEEEMLANSRRGEYQQRHHFSALIISHLFLLCSFFLSHPLYFFYFIFLAPYLLKLLSFLSPLLITTALLLLLLALLAVSSSTAHPPPQHSLHSSLGNAFRSALEKLRSQADAPIGDPCDHALTDFEELDAYKIVFRVSEIPAPEPPGEDPDSVETETLIRDSHEIPVEIKHVNEEEEAVPPPEKDIWCETVSYRKAEEEEQEAVEVSGGRAAPPVAERQPPPWMMVEMNRSESMRRVSEVTAYPVAEKQEQQQPPWMSAEMSRSESMREPMSRADSRKIEDTHHLLTIEKVGIRRPLSPNLRGLGSMRREKEWKRTLACKLFEERHNGGGGGGGGGEGMDSLWEAYEVESDKLQQRGKKSKAKKEMKKTKSRSKKGSGGGEEEEEEEEEEECGGDSGDEAAQLCCLQALKLSAGKMGVGMGRPGLVKIGRAMKGIGWLHRVGSARFARKNNND